MHFLLYKIDAVRYVPVMNMNNSARYDVVVSGGGMVGMALSIALASGGLKVAVIEKAPFDRQHLPDFDGRVSAIAYGSRVMLENLGVWRLLENEAEPIWDIRVSDADSSAHLHYSHKEVGDTPFGYIVENRFTRRALFERASQVSNLEVIAPDAIRAIHPHPHIVEIETSAGRQLEASLLVGAEGRFSCVREAAGIKMVGDDYGQTAIVCTISHEFPHNGLAQERFLPVGPFAVLPMTNNRSSLVWVESPDTAKHLISLPKEELAKEIIQRVGEYLGSIKVEGECFTYALGVQHAKAYVAGRLVLVGDAAHAIHPLAGQGLNLGLRDAAVLSELVIDAARLGLDMGSATVLEHYQQWRRFDNVAMTLATDGLNRLFSTELLPVKLSRRLGLWGVGQIPALKRYFIRNAMGAEGKVPKLMQKVAK